MLSTHFSRELIGLKEIIVKKVEQKEKEMEITIELERHEQDCPCCARTTRTIHDYRNQRVRDIPAFGKQVVLILRKRRYTCPSCGKHFAERNSFLPKYYRMTNRLALYVTALLTDTVSFTSVSKQVGLSLSTVIRIFDLVNYPKATMPQVLSIDEFKGNAGGDKYQVILTDPKTGRVLDILPSRKKYALIQYFKPMQRERVQFFVSDMWQPYHDIATSFFKQAVPLIDKYHFVRQVIWAFEDVRKQEQKKFSKSHRIYFKRSKKLLTRPFPTLDDTQKQQVNVMLYASPTLSSAYFLKEQFFQFLHCKDRDTAKMALLKWMDASRKSNIPRFAACAETFHNWFTPILNTFDAPYTNGFTEGCNNRIKVLKRNAYGYRNFQRFRNRILHVFHNSYLEKHQAEIAA